MEFGRVVAAGVPHDRVVVAERRGKWIEHRRRLFVRRVALAGLDRAPRALHPDEAVARSKRRALRRRSRDLHQGLVLHNDSKARVAIWGEIMPRAYPERGEIARNAPLRTLVEHIAVPKVD